MTAGSVESLCGSVRLGRRGVLLLGGHMGGLCWIVPENNPQRALSHVRGGRPNPLLAVITTRHHKSN